MTPVSSAPRKNEAAVDLSRSRLLFCNGCNVSEEKRERTGLPCAPVERKLRLNDAKFQGYNLIPS